MNRGIIVSIQGYSYNTTQELVNEVINAGCTAIRTDKFIKSSIPLIGLKKQSVNNPAEQPYITSSIDDIKDVATWADYVAVDCRKLNKNLINIYKYCKENDIKIVADIADIEDFKNIKENGLNPEYIATTLSVFNVQNYKPDITLVKSLAKMGCKNIIAEGNYQTRQSVKWAFLSGSYAVCIGSAISNIYKLTRKFVSLESEKLWTKKIPSY